MQPRYGCSLMQPVQAFATFPCFRFTNTVDLFSIGITPPYKTSLFPPACGRSPNPGQLVSLWFLVNSVPGLGTHLNRVAGVKPCRPNVL